MGWTCNRLAAWQRICLMLAVFALAPRMLIPQGFMIADTGGSSALAICTGHGPLSMGNDDHGAPKDQDHKKADAPCSGVGNLTSNAPPSAALVSVTFDQVTSDFFGVDAIDLMPGRGLAAPPPQSHAPPSI
jgi:hypothetical protein